MTVVTRARWLRPLARHVARHAARHVARHAAVLATQWRASVLVTMQYRLELAAGLLMAVFWTTTALVPLLVLFSQRPTVAGWSWHEALLVIGWFNVFKGVQASLIQPSMQQAVAQVRDGTLDFVLIKPADAQFLVSTSRFELRQMSDVVAGVAILVYAMARLQPPVAVTTALVLKATLALACGLAVLYSLWVMVMSLAFVFVKIDNMTYLFASIFDAARWPANVYRGALAWLFTFVLPLAVMTTYPALALRNQLSAGALSSAVVTAAIFLLLARFVWRACIRRYTSAGG